MEDIEIVPVDGAIWVKPHERSGVHVSGYWRLPNGEVLDDAVAEEIIRLKQKTIAEKESLPSQSLKKSNRMTMTDSIDPTDVSSIIDKGKRLESELGIDSLIDSDSPDVQAEQFASRLSDWMSTHAKGGNGEHVRNAVGRYASELNESISVLPNTVKKNLSKPGYMILVDSTQGSKVSHAMKMDMSGYFYQGRILLPPSPVDYEIKKPNGNHYSAYSDSEFDSEFNEYSDSDREFMKNTKVGNVIVSGYSYMSYDKEEFEDGSKSATALMKINDDTVRKVVLGQKFRVNGWSLRKIADEADVVVPGYPRENGHVKTPVYEVKERHEASGSAIIMKKPNDKKDERFKQVLMHEYVHYLQASSKTFTEAAESAYKMFDGGVNTDKDAFEGRTHRGFGQDTLDYASTNSDEFMAEASAMLFHPADIKHLMISYHVTPQDAHDTNRVRQWALGFWASVADGSIEV